MAMNRLNCRDYMQNKSNGKIHSVTYQIYSLVTIA
jgi:hypothetical protein